MTEGVLVAFALGVLVLALRILFLRGALKVGQDARARTVARTGKDPADNRVNHSINRWAGEHPVGVKVVTGVLIAIGLTIAVLRRMN